MNTSDFNTDIDYKGSNSFGISHGSARARNNNVSLRDKVAERSEMAEPFGSGETDVNATENSRDTMSTKSITNKLNKINSDVTDSDKSIYNHCGGGMKSDGLKQRSNVKSQNRSDNSDVKYKLTGGVNNKDVTESATNVLLRNSSEYRSSSSKYPINYGRGGHYTHSGGDNGTSDSYVNTSEIKFANHGASSSTKSSKTDYNYDEKDEDDDEDDDDNNDNNSNNNDDDETVTVMSDISRSEKKQKPKPKPKKTN